ncbi:DUF5675 family protein [Rickettsiales bacterium]|nr:DUF5675 family protein [Rickettsiales bacterium]
MENFILKRKYRNGEATLGTLLNEHEEEICKTLENPWLDNEQGVSCIPEGIYEVQVDDTGRFQYWKILNVPERDAVEIHYGNREKDTRGCVIFGKRWGFIADELAVLTSKPTLNRLKKNKTLPDKFSLQITS